MLFGVRLVGLLDGDERLTLYTDFCRDLEKYITSFVNRPGKFGYWDA